MAAAPPLSSLVRPFVPAPLRKSLKDFYLQRKLDGVIARLRRLGSGEAPSRGLLEDLQDAWDNEGMAARTDYLHEVAGAAAAARGPILECGSGLTTLISGIVGGNRGLDSWSLEHLAEWRDRIAAVVARNRLKGAHVCLTPLRDFGSYAWYDAPIDGMPSQFHLVICDGPPGQTKGGRYGLLPRMHDRLAPGATILLDDVDRPGEMDVLARWGMRHELRGSYAIAFVDRGFRLQPEAVTTGAA
jgi:hypothetical protein